jgi:hypothetical protein
VWEPETTLAGLAAQLDDSLAPLAGFLQLGFGGLDLFLDKCPHPLAKLKHLRGHPEINRHSYLPRGSRVRHDCYRETRRFVKPEES